MCNLSFAIKIAEIYYIYFLEPENIILNIIIIKLDNAKFYMCCQYFYLIYLQLFLQLSQNKGHCSIIIFCSSFVEKDVILFFYQITTRKTFYIHTLLYTLELFVHICIRRQILNIVLTLLELLCSELSSLKHKNIDKIY